MKPVRFLASVAAVLSLFSLQAQAQTEVQWWHSMTAVNGEWVNDLAKQGLFVYKGRGNVPYYPDVAGAPQNTVIGGASL